MAENQEQQQQDQEQQAIVDDPPAPENIPGALPLQDQKIVSDDGLEIEMPPHQGGFYPNAPPFLPHQQHAMVMAQYYEARMRDHAAAYASAAAGAAWAAAQIAVSSQLPPSLSPPIVYPPHYHPEAIAYPPPPYQNFHPPHVATQNSDFAPDERPVKRHQRMPLNNNEQQERRGRRRQRVDFSSSSDGGRFNLKYQRQKHNYDKKRREKLNLVGKTGVSALHEWCVHCKKLTPNFVLLPGPTDYFCFAAYVDDLEWSRGRGATKASAKQDAARKALQALVPGVVFGDSGLVMEMTASEAIEDLPNLAERLAIDATKKRRCEIYPGTTTSTTTEDDGEDENSYYANRGASVCSALLHAMWQINDDIPEPPSYSYDVPSNSTNSGKDGSRPSSFACTATLNLRVNETTHAAADNKGHEINLSDLKIAPGDATTPAPPARPTTIKVLTGVGTGATKREARHVASAKLLSMLFPDCEGMVEVKAAAEGAREQYAESKAFKQQTKRFASTSKQPQNNFSPFLGNEDSWLAKPSDPELPQSVINMIRSITGQGIIASVSSARVEEDEVSVESLSLSETTTTTALVGADSKSEARACSRQQQLEKMVDNALQTLNEFDEEGRSLPHELNFDDVGRTVLRRAEAGDARFIYKVLLNKVNQTMSDLSPMQDIMSASRRRFWGPASVALLLCRAIASYDEPPLGCAVLTLGFSFTKGRVLRVAEIGSEPHLPRERLLECLQQFAVNMKCTLDIEQSKTRMQQEEMHMMTTPHTIVDSFLKRKDFLLDESGAKLQSVKEEEPEVEEDSKEPGRPKQAEGGKDKPSKRSRID